MSQPIRPVRFFDRVQPALLSGAYQAEISQSISAGTDQAEYKAVQSFTVTGPRLALDPNDLFTAYPPDQSTGDWREYLPHLVLNRRTLPWERTIDDSPVSGGTEALPWLAALLFDPDELRSPDGPDPGVTAQSPIRSFTIGLDELLQPPAGTLGPQFSPAAVAELKATEAGSRFSVIDVAAGAFRGLLPGSQELPFLAHARQVDVADKALQSANPEGWFSVVVANRLPNPGALNIAHLVSLEGFGGYLDGKGSLDGIQWVRLVSLSGWSFTCLPAAPTFAGIVQGLDAGLVQMPMAIPTPATDGERVVNGALQMGYTALAYQTGTGEQTPAWYRGPLLPVQTTRNFKDPYPSAEMAMLYDPKTGLFDLSYAVAWSTGRLLALADQSYSVSLINWRREGHRLIDLLQERTQLFQHLDCLEAPADPAELLDPHLLRRTTSRYLAALFGRLIDPEQDAIKPLLGRPLDRTGLLGRAGLPGLIRPEQMAAWLEAGQDPHRALARWLANGPDSETGGV